MANNEVNKVLYPQQYDTIQNWPPTTAVTQTTGEDITRNRNALLIIERILGLNPQIGLWTKDPVRATIAERLSILELGLSEGTYQLKKLKVDRAIDTLDANGIITLLLGAPNTLSNKASNVNIIGPLVVKNSGIKDPRALFEVGLRVVKESSTGESTDVEIFGSSSKNRPLVRIRDYNKTVIQSQDNVALWIEGNLFVDGFISGNFAIDHSKLNNINTTPLIDQKGNIIKEAIHVTHGNYHSHKRGEYDPVLGRWKVDPSPKESVLGLISHVDLEPQTVRTSTRQINFLPDPDVAYHVTNGDDHDHTGGDGAPIKHAFLLGIDPKTSNHVTFGDFHRHDPSKGDGGLVPTNGVVLEKGIETGLTNIGSLTSEENLSGVLASINAKFGNHESRIIVIEQTIESLKPLPQLFIDFQNAVNQTIDEFRIELKNKVDKTGDTMTGNLVMSNNATVKQVPDPLEDLDAVNRRYVDTRIKRRMKIFIGTPVGGQLLTNWIVPTGIYQVKITAIGGGGSIGINGQPSICEGMVASGGGAGTTTDGGSGGNGGIGASTNPDDFIKTGQIGSNANILEDGGPSTAVGGSGSLYGFGAGASVSFSSGTNHTPIFAGGAGGTVVGFRDVTPGQVIAIIAGANGGNDGSQAGAVIIEW